MAMDPMDREPNVYTRETNVYEREGRGSNTLAYVIGGLVIALGLLAFLFYDGGTDEPTTTGSTGTQTESSPTTGSGASGGSSTAPAAPMSPSAPSAPANPQ